MDLGDLAKAQQFSERAVDGFRLRGQRRFEAPSLNRLAKILRRRGDIEGAIALHQQAMLIYQEIGDVLGEISVMTAMTAAYRDKGDLTRARLNADETRIRAATLGDDLARADAFMQSAYVDSDFSSHESARDHFAAALALFERLGDPAGVREANRGMALASLELGNYAEALQIAQQSMEIAVASANVADQARAQWLLGRIAEASGNPAAARGHYSSSLTMARDVANDPLLVAAGTSLAQLELDSGNIDQAADLTEEIRDRAAAQRDFMRLDARLALAQEDRARALAVMSRLRASAGEAWLPADESLIRELEYPSDEAAENKP